MIKTVLLVIALILLLTGCVMNTTVVFNTEPPNAQVYLDGRAIGRTPTTVRVSNAVWEDPIVRITAEGYRDYVGSLNREIKVANGVFGLVLWWPSLLWVWGPKNVQYYALIEGKP